MKPDYSLLKENNKKAKPATDAKYIFLNPQKHFMHYFYILTNTKTMEQDLTSKVWQIGGIFSSAKPGYLVLNDGKMAFVNQQGEQFNVPLSEVKEVKWPGLQMGFGFNAVVQGNKYKFTFMKPNGAPEMGDSGLSQLARYTRVGMAMDSISALAKWGDSKKSAKAWKEVLGG